jgi:hypothetical protein
VKKNVTVWVKNEDFIKLDENSKQLHVDNFLNGIFERNFKDLSKEEQIVYKLLADLFNIELLKNQKKKSEFNEQSDEFNEVSDTEVIEDSDIDDFENIIDFSYPECTSYPVSGGYNIETIT